MFVMSYVKIHPMRKLIFGLFAEDWRLLKLIYTFWTMLRNVPCMGWICIQWKTHLVERWVEYDLWSSLAIIHGFGLYIICHAETHSMSMQTSFFANLQVNLGVSACGLYVYHGKLRIECFKWPRILKMEYKRNVFRVKVRPAEVSLTLWYMSVLYLVLQLATVVNV